MLFVSAVFLVVFLFSSKALAHPGGLASDGCHYCRTNCAKWGYVTGTRHCHSGASSLSRSGDSLGSGIALGALGAGAVGWYVHKKNKK